MSEAKPKKPAKISDVARPSEVAAPATSRPVIVGHTNTIQKDPMVAGAAPASDLETTDSQNVTESSSLSVKKAEKTIVAPPAPVSTKTEETNEAPEEPDESAEPSTSESAMVDALAGGVNTKKDRLAEEEHENKVNEEVQKLVDSKEYYVKTRTPANKRNKRWLFAFIVGLLLIGAGWYVAVGPGKSLWSQDNVATVAPAPTQSSEKTTPVTPPAPEKLSFSKPELGVSFSYPKTWKVETTKDIEFDTRDVFTLTSETQELKTAFKGVPPATAEVYLRVRIIAENTLNDKEYASDLVNLSTCSSEDIIIGSSPLKLLFVDLAKEGPNVSQVSLSPNNCQANGSISVANDQVQFSTKKDTYIMYGEYVYSEAYLKKNGTTTPEAIALAQESGVVATKTDFRSTKIFSEFTDIIKSFTEL